MKKVKIAILQY